MRVAESGEFGLLRELERRGLVTGIGDDVAVLSDGLVATTDLLLEDVHFRLAWLPWRDLGYKAAAVNLSDLAAAGAEPLGFLVALGLPASTAVEDVAELYAGLAEMGVPVLGGDTTRAESVVLSVTALGRSDRVPGRKTNYQLDISLSGDALPSGVKRIELEIYAAGQKPEGQITEVSYLIARPGDPTPVAKVSFVTRVADIYCGVGYYKK